MAAKDRAACLHTKTQTLPVPFAFYNQSSLYVPLSGKGQAEKTVHTHVLFLFL